MPQLVQLMACGQVGTEPLSEPILTLLIGPLGINFSEISIEIHAFLLKKNVLENVVWKMAAILSPSQRVSILSRMACDVLSQ